MRRLLTREKSNTTYIRENARLYIHYFLVKTLRYTQKSKNSLVVAYKINMYFALTHIFLLPTKFILNITNGTANDTNKAYKIP